MPQDLPRGIAVADVGYTNVKVILFSPGGKPVAERKAASRHIEGPPYRHIDPAPMVDLLRRALPELDAILPVDVVVPCAHGAALACLDAEGNLALPVMDYTSEAPEEIVADYKKIMPPFSESFCPLLPMTITHGLQLYWQQRSFPQGFAAIRTVIPWIQYVGFVLGGKSVTEITSMSCQTHLVDVAHGGPSSLAKRQGWAKFFPPFAKAWEEIGTLKPEFRGRNFRGRGAVLAGIHDSTGNYMRYRAAGLSDFTLLSSGTWTICFDTTTTVDQLREEYDTSTNTDIFGRNVATSRFFGGKEYEVLAGDAAEATPSLAWVRDLVAKGVMALPSFTGSPGPMPGTAHRGKIIGALSGGKEERASLASLYCALMVSEQLDHVGSRHDIIVDGPLSTNDTFLGVLAALRAPQAVKASDLRDGTTAGAACLALIRDGQLPNIGLTLKPVEPAGIAGLKAYQAQWKENAHANRG